LSDDEAAAVVAGLKDVARNGLGAARHLRGDIYEVRIEARVRSFRVLFAVEGKHVLLALSAFVKKTRAGHALVHSFDDMVLTICL
jgi:putative component of toxin-antitoxin plasmid stabilization module